MNASTGADGGRVPWRDADPATFSATILAAADQLGVQPLAVEKDYWVCEALRAIEGHAPGVVIFKGGTSLEKLRIIRRFSEDLDLLVVGEFANVREGKAALKGLCGAAAAGTGGALSDEVSGGVLGAQHRRAYLLPPMRGTAAVPGVADPDRVLLELGQSGGAHPASARRIESLLTRQLALTTFDVHAYVDLAPFEVRVLHPGRTLIEKLLRMNNFAVMSDEARAHHTWPRIGRQFYDVWALLGHEEVREFLSDEDLAREVLEDCVEVSKAFLGDQPPPDGGFAHSAVFDPDGPDAARLRAEHEIAMRALYYGTDPAPSFEEALARVHEHRALLAFAS